MGVIPSAVCIQSWGESLAQMWCCYDGNVEAFDCAVEGVKKPPAKRGRPSKLAAATAAASNESSGTFKSTLIMPPKFKDCVIPFPRTSQPKQRLNQARESSKKCLLPESRAESF